MKKVNKWFEKGREVAQEALKEHQSGGRLPNFTQAMIDYGPPYDCEDGWRIDRNQDDIDFEAGWDSVLGEYSFYG